MTRIGRVYIQSLDLTSFIPIPVNMTNHSLKYFPFPCRRYSGVIKKAEKSIKNIHERLFPQSPVPKIYLQSAKNNRQEILDHQLVPDEILRQFVPEIVSSTTMLIAQLVSWMTSVRKKDVQAFRTLDIHNFGSYDLMF